MNKCPVCGNNCEKEYCWKHQSRKPLRKSNIIPKKRHTAGNNEHDFISNIAVPNGEGVYNNIKMREFFLGIWAKRPHKSEVSGDKLFGEPNSTYFHHILEKKNHPEAMYDEENIIILSSTEHEQVHLDIYRYEEINKRREKLKEKYGI